MDSTEKFTGKAEVYAQFRPSYPDEYLDYLADTYTLNEGSRIADIGAGTGIFTKLLLERGYEVTGVEPNADMRETCLAFLKDYPRFTLVNAAAEHTGLNAGSFDLVTAAQSFHWFDTELFRAECRRILKPGGASAALVWNSRDASSEAVQENARIFEEYCPAFSGFSGGIFEPSFTACGGALPDDLSVFSRFFLRGAYEYRCFPRSEEYDLDGFIGRSLSASYAPVEGDPSHFPLIAVLTGLFEKYCINSRLNIPIVTRSYTGRV